MVLVDKLFSGVTTQSYQDRLADKMGVSPASAYVMLCWHIYETYSVFNCPGT